MIIQFVRLKSPLAEEELLKRANDRKPQFQALPGLLQKYYLKLDEPGQYAGLYIWDSAESLMAFRDSDLAKSIPEAYEVSEPPNIELLNVLFQLRDQS
jgi:heme-degrading monooxygenase HmoA